MLTMPSFTWLVTIFILKILVSYHKSMVQYFLSDLQDNYTYLELDNKKYFVGIGSCRMPHTLSVSAIYIDP